jgi:hypothetical protein
MFFPLLLIFSLLPYLSLAAVSWGTISSTVLVIAKDNDTAYDAVTGLQSYGIPYQVLAVPSQGVTLPTLSTSNTGKFGGIVIMSQVTYGYSDGWRSALTAAQLTTIYTYCTNFGVRLVWIDAYPDSSFGSLKQTSD